MKINSDYIVILDEDKISLYGKDYPDDENDMYEFHDRAFNILKLIHEKQLDTNHLTFEMCKIYPDDSIIKIIADTIDLLEAFERGKIIDHLD